MVSQSARNSRHQGLGSKHLTKPSPKALTQPQALTRNPVNDKDVGRVAGLSTRGFELNVVQGLSLFEQHMVEVICDMYLRDLKIPCEGLQV